MRNSRLKTFLFAGLLFLLVLGTGWYVSGINFRNSPAGREKLERKLALQNLQQLQVCLANFARDVRKTNSQESDPVYPAALEDLIAKNRLSPEMLKALTKGFTLEYQRPPNTATQDAILFTAKGHDCIVTYFISGDRRVDEIPSP
ncbi:MAG: hypothetical protein ABI615_03665 [Chthoniobacterales bacterium]